MLSTVNCNHFELKSEVIPMEYEVIPMEFEVIPMELCKFHWIMGKLGTF